MFQCVIFAILLHMAIVAPQYALDQPKNSAYQVIEQLQESLLDVMKNAEELGYEGRRKKLDPIIRSNHSLSRIARVAVGRSWKKINPEQKAMLVKTFSEFSVASYASMFDGYTGEQFKILGAEQQKQGRMLVRTILTKSDGEKIHLDYVLSQDDGRWQIINISTNGISDLALKRAEYTSVIKKEGFDELLNKLKKKIKDFSATPSTSLDVGQTEH